MFNIYIHGYVNINFVPLSGFSFSWGTYANQKNERPLYFSYHSETIDM